MAVRVPGHQTAAAVPGQRGDRLRLRQRGGQRPGGQVPDQHPVIAAARGQAAPVRAERDRVHPVGGPGQGALRYWPGGRGHVPQPDLLILAARRRSVRPSGLNATALTCWAGPVSGLPSGTGRAGSDTFHSRTVLSALPAASRVGVRAERHRLHVARRSGQRRAGRRRMRWIGHVPEPDRVIGAARGQERPAGTEGQRVHGVRRSGQAGAEPGWASRRRACPRAAPSSRRPRRPGVCRRG